MDKELLKSVISSLKANDTINVNFVTNYNAFNGEYKVTRLATGKGKGGSLIMELCNTTTGDVLKTLTMSDGKTKCIGTPISEFVLNITCNGKMHGVNSESELPHAFPRDKDAGNELRDMLKPLVKKTTPTTLKISSARAPEFNGTWNVQDAKLHAGRGGQVSLRLVDVTDSTKMLELWSYRHASVIDSVEEI